MFGTYTYVDATYRLPVTLASALEGNDVAPGNRFSMSPRHRGAAGVQLERAVQRATLDATLSARGVSPAFLRGDEANRTPPLPGYVVLELQVGARWRRTRVGLAVANLLDRRYLSYGVFADNPKGPVDGPVPVSENVERFLTPGYPRTLSVTVAVEP